MAKLYRTNGAIENIIPKNGKTFTLEELQNYVDGYIERIDMHNGNAMYVNEEGKLLGLKRNVAASVTLNLALCQSNVIVGNAVVLSIEEE